MQAVTHTSILFCRLSRGDISITIIVAFNRPIKDSERFDFAVVTKANDCVAVFCWSVVSVVHGGLLLKFRLA